MNKLSVLLAALLTSACINAPVKPANRWQERANTLQTNLEELAKKIQMKDDFVRRWGPPTGCSKLSKGELCDWITAIGNVGGSFGSAMNNPYIGQPIGATLATVNVQHSRAKIFRVEFNDDGRYIHVQGILRSGGNDYIGVVEN